MNGVTLQVNITTADLRCARLIVPHQIRQLGNQIDRIVLNVDTGATSTRDGTGQGPATAGEPLERWLRELRTAHPALDMRSVDYSDAAVQRVADTLYAGRIPPRVDFRGRPIYAYLEPLLSAPTHWVLHLDSDMLLGGGSRTWLREIQLAMTGGGHVIGSPYPGPPRHDRVVLRQPGVEYVPGMSAILVPNMSSRIFLTHVPTFVDRLAPLPLPPAPLKGRIWTLRQPNPPYEKLERAVTARMNELGLRRLDLLGEPPGMWSLHPPYRSEAFYRRLPELIARVESDDLPHGQRGDFDLGDRVIDWTDARRVIRRSRIRAMVLGRRA